MGTSLWISLGSEGSELDLISLIANVVWCGVQAPLNVRGVEIFVGAYIGIATDSAEQAELEDLLRLADLALYTVKRSGKGGGGALPTCRGAREVEPYRHVEILSGTICS